MMVRRRTRRLRFVARALRRVGPTSVVVVMMVVVSVMVVMVMALARRALSVRQLLVAGRFAAAGGTVAPGMVMMVTGGITVVGLGILLVLRRRLHDVRGRGRRRGGRIDRQRNALRVG